VLIEVPVMLSVVAIVNRSRGWYEAGLPPARSLAAENEISAVITEATEPPAEEGHA
jgi:ACR3 family arsenite transporter